ncbi:PREDICTED: lisH domain and HEAT repeat-containing protein KIAA1468 homolog isoform X1 [Trachymyrmex cornetzi]|uniref:lisH domain and HEAT repeat-containing protein KIAA1468 homolog isoform X1 n=1 Tax=Trachymyrmex cornetzi TaxID=471704 RepID=UPI00084F6941|nr:PREDICTED: lisH domain and HEAT repeat-containing protein KIAA1468 homolog isoform X1 [Trachymyrmex cornetzi]
MASIIEEISLPANNRGYVAPKTLISYEEMATKLLNEKLFLTALELHAELCEAGKELPILKEFFSNPNNFESSNIKPEPYTSMPRSSSQATLDSLDMTRYSEDGAGVDERVAILEFELRKAKENISALRANLTVVTELEGTLKTPDKNSKKNLITELPIKPHEQRALNFLINEYLLARSYKLTSITFSDECEEQDFEDWQDVGLNIPKPTELLQIYREYMKTNGYDKLPSISVAVQTDFVIEDVEEQKDESLEMAEQIERLQQQIAVLEQEKNALQEVISSNKEIVIENPVKSGSCGTIRTINSNSTTPDKFELLEPLPRDMSTTTQEPEEDDSVSAVVSLDETDPGDKEWTRLQLPRVNITEKSSVLPTASSRNLPSKFKSEIVKHCMANVSGSLISSVGESLKHGITRDTLVDILACTLPRVVPNIILNRREEIIPLILSAIHLHSNSSERDKLLQMLFNLKKRPHEDERQMILAGLIVMAKLAEESLETEEILTICWEQSQHKYPERRLLAVECCSVLASYTSASIRNSLMLSMLQQMLLEDKDPVVRTSVVKSLALLIALMDDPDKYFQCEELVLTALHDTSSMVVETASSVLLPVLAQWALSLRRLHLNLLPRIISKVKNQLKPIHSQTSPNKKDYVDEEKLTPSISILQCILPYTVLCVANTDAVRACIKDDTSPDLCELLEEKLCGAAEEFLALCHSNIIDPRIFYEDSVDVGVLLNTFFSNSWEDASWPELEWFTNKLVFEVLDMVKSVDAAQENVLKALLTYIYSLCVGFGKYITQSRIQAVFSLEVSELEKQLTALSADKKNMSLPLIPSYLMILSTFDFTELANYFKQFLVVLSMSGTSISWLQIAANILCAHEQTQEYVLSSLWDGVMHQRPSVRCVTATLFGSIIAHISDQLANTKIVPAIVTLASDPEVDVRCAAISTLGHIITECKVREARDKGRLTLETIAKDPQELSQTLATSLVSTFAVIAPTCPQNYIENIIATHLSTIVSFALQQSHKIELINALVEAYSVLVYCPLSSQCVSGVVLPGLRNLETLVNQCLPQQKDAVRSLLREAESKQDLSKPIDRTPSSSGLSLSMATVNVGQGVEDMRQRMSKIFQHKTGSPGIPSIFRKK